MLINDMAATMASIVFKHLFETLNLPDTFGQELVRYLQPMHDALANFRGQYLRKMLMGPPYAPSKFRLLTYYGNGMAGNISDTEDIIDRVIAFV